MGIPCGSCYSRGCILRLPVNRNTFAAIPTVIQDYGAGFGLRLGRWGLLLGRSGLLLGRSSFLKVTHLCRKCTKCSIETLCALMSKLGDQQAKYNFQGTIAFIIMKSLQAISFGGNRPWT